MPIDLKLLLKIQTVGAVATLPSTAFHKNDASNTSRISFLDCPRLSITVGLASLTNI